MYLQALRDNKAFQKNTVQVFCCKYTHNKTNAFSIGMHQPVIVIISLTMYGDIGEGTREHGARKGSAPHTFSYGGKGG